MNMTMTKEQFLEAINEHREPKYELREIHEGVPSEDGAYLILTESNRVLIGVYENNQWSQGCFTTTKFGKQECYQKALTEKVVYYAQRESKQ
jgi:hypothetical protein